MTRCWTTQQSACCYTRPPLLFIVSTGKQDNLGRAYGIGKMHGEGIIADHKSGAFDQCHVLSQSCSTNQASSSRRVLHKLTQQRGLPFNTGHQYRPAFPTKETSDGTKSLYRITARLSAGAWMHKHKRRIRIKPRSFKERGYALARLFGDSKHQPPLPGNK